MGGFQVNEVVTLVVAMVFVPFVLVTLREPRIPGRSYIFATYAALLIAQVSTNLEAFILPDALNLLEHLATAVAAVSFALLTYDLARRRTERGAGS